ncbi:MAG TPA: hypothetical protein VNA44_01710 [Burkholderiaceae bacterium]|nr:hypothetical protein [Burkholderiaceae bacterium]
MKNARLIVVIAALAITGCATSFAPSDNFNDWTNSASYHHYQQRAVAAAAPNDDNKTAGE